MRKIVIGLFCVLVATACFTAYSFYVLLDTQAQIAHLEDIMLHSHSGIAGIMRDRLLERVPEETALALGSSCLTVVFGFVAVVVVKRVRG